MLQFFLMSAALVAVVMAEAPAAPAAPAAPEGWRPSGRLLLLPARLQYPLEADQGTSTTTQPPTNTTQSQSDESQSEKLLDSGEYYVLLPDGRLQMVKYTTAAIREAEEAASNSQQAAAPAQQQQAFQYRSPFPAGSSNFQRQQQKPAAAPAPAPALPEPFARFQIEYLQFPQPQYAQQPAEDKREEPKSAQNKAEEKEEEVSGFEANVQYRDVKPISAPVYAYNQSPLVRILKK
ncbi:hypothetical protein J6590_071432 [Homalodisca vitripennis]|nr:hypothetical protein J6590_071432 [Homalodisca vitripennis]